MTVIDAVVPGTAKDFIKNEILDKLGITNYSWQTHVSGLPANGGTELQSDLFWIDAQIIEDLRPKK